MTTKLPEDVTSSLQKASQHSRPTIQQRAQIILMTLDEKSLTEIVEATQLSERTVVKWQQAWEKDGLAIFPAEILAEEASPPPVPPSTFRLNLQFRTHSGILATDPVSEAGRKLFLFNLEQLILHEPIAILDNDIEGVHKMRVAIRRIRSFFKLIRNYLDEESLKRVNQSLRKTARRLGQVRDLDIILLKTQHYIDAQLGGDANALHPLLDILHTRRQKAHHKLVEWLHNPDYDRFIIHFYSLVQEAQAGIMPARNGLPAGYRVNEVVPRLVYTCLENIRAYETHLADADATTFHALRLEFKQFRYTLEAFREVLGESVKPVIAASKDIQDHLGDLNDAEVAQVYLKKLLHKLPTEAKAAVQAYRNTRQAEAEELMAAMLDAWLQFNRSEIREALALAIAVL